MNDAELRLECIRLATLMSGGEPLDQAKKLYEWVTGTAPEDATEQDAGIPG